MTPDWYLNQLPSDLQSNTLSLCHQGQWYIEGNFTLIIYLGPKKITTALPKATWLTS